MKELMKSSGEEMAPASTLSLECSNPKLPRKDP